MAFRKTSDIKELSPEMLEQERLKGAEKFGLDKGYNIKPLLTSPSGEIILQDPSQMVGKPDRGIESRQFLGGPTQRELALEGVKGSLIERPKSKFVPQLISGDPDQSDEDALARTTELRAMDEARQDAQLRAGVASSFSDPRSTKEQIGNAAREHKDEVTYNEKTTIVDDSDVEILSNIASDANYDLDDPSHPILGKMTLQRDGVSLAQQLEDSFGINQSNKSNYGGAITLVLSRIFAQNSTMTYAQQVLSTADRDTLEQGDVIDIDFLNPSLTPEADTSLPDVMEKGRVELKKSLMRLQHEPVVRHMLHDIVGQMRRLMNPGQEQDRRIGPSDLAASAALIRMWTDKGYIAWNRDKQGRLLPLNTNINPLIGIDRSKRGKSKEEAERDRIERAETNQASGDLQKHRKRKPTALDKLNQIYFSDMRTVNNYIVPDSQLSPIIDGNLASSAMNVVIKNNGKPSMGKGKVSEANIHGRNHLAHGTSNVAITGLAYIASQVGQAGNAKGYFDHDLAPVLGELGQESRDKYQSKRKKTPDDDDGMGAELAKQEITDKYERLLRNLENKILPRARDGLNRFMKHYMSPSTNRVFGLAADLNYYNDKADIRATLAFGNVIPVNLDNKFFDKSYVINLAKKNLTSNKDGEAFGLDINEKLQKLDDPEMQTLDFYYALANVMLSLDTNQNKKQKDFIRRDPNKLIEWLFNKPTSSSIAPIVSANKIGGQIQQLFDKPTHDNKKNSIVEKNVNEIPDWETLSSQYPEVSQILKTGKGEWQYPLTVLSELGRLNLEKETNPDKKEGKFNFRFNYTFEQDARQSNAAIISMVMGDAGIADLLGLYQEDDVNQAQFLDLRDKIFNGVGKHIDATFSSPEDAAVIRSAYQEFFKKLGDEDGPYRGMNPSKLYARSIIVAGLYGKSPRMMYTEAAEFLAKVPAIEQDLLAATELQYNVEGEEARTLMYRDMANLFNTSAQATMSELLGYQNYMRSYGRVMGTLRGPTTIPGWLPNEEINLSIDNWSSTYNMVDEGGLNEALRDETGGLFNVNIKKPSSREEKRIQKINKKRAQQGKEPIMITNQVSDPRGRALYGTEDVMLGGITNLADSGASAKYAAQKDRESVDRKERDFAKNYEGILGTNFRNALPVDLIQAGDSALMMLAMQIAGGANPSLPPNIFAIHDAAITTAGSTLKFKNAYDNIAMPMMASSGRNMITNSWMGVLDTINNTLKEVDDLPGEGAVVDIGTERIVTEKGRIKNFSAITGYFDELYDQTFGDNPLYNEYELQRGMKDGKPKPGSNKDYMEFLNAKNERILKLAEDNGWEPPSDLFAVQQRRARKKVTKSQFKNLVQLIEEKEGIFQPQLPGKKESRKELIGPIKDSKGALYYHNRYNNASSIVDKVVNKVIGARGQLTDASRKPVFDINGNAILKLKLSEEDRKGSRLGFMDKVFRQSRWNNNLQYG